MSIAALFKINFSLRMCGCMLICFSHVQLCATLWTIAHQAPLSMGFSRKEYWSGLPHSPPGNLPNPGIEPTSLGLLHRQVGSLPLASPGKSSLGISIFGGKIIVIKLPFLCFQFKFNLYYKSLFAKSEDLSNIRLSKICRVNHEKCWAGRSTSWN